MQLKLHLLKGKQILNIMLKKYIIGDIIQSSKTADQGIICKLFSVSPFCFKLNLIMSCTMIYFGCGQQQKCHVATHPPAGVRGRMERNRQRLVGGDKGSLTEQQ